ncbi:MAG: isoamylase early set domain-containing protein [Actinomycetota bacterium]|nr:isoamylase early set domain-containing protein [Actinomycetota bacterium]
MKVTFALPLDEAVVATSVVGDFNDWDPLAHPLKKRSNGTRSVTLELPAGSYRFKYLAEDGVWFCDPAADELEIDEHSVENSVVHV